MLILIRLVYYSHLVLVKIAVPYFSEPEYIIQRLTFSKVSLVTNNIPDILFIDITVPLGYTRYKGQVYYSKSTIKNLFKGYIIRTTKYDILKFPFIIPVYIDLFVGQIIYQGYVIRKKKINKIPGVMYLKGEGVY